MNRRLCMVVAALGFASPALAGSSELVGRWAQVTSTGGDCPSCELSISTRGDRLAIEASNDWSAEVASTLRPGETSVAGVGLWPNWEDRPVRVFFLLDGNDDLIMQMAIRHPNGRDQIVHAAFQRGASF